MGRILLEGGLIVLLVLIGISVFIPSSNNDISDVIIDFEQSIEEEEVIEDGEIKDVVISDEYSPNLVAKLNGKIANVIVDGLNGVFSFGMMVLTQ